MDATANPYIALAALICAGLLVRGIPALPGLSHAFCTRTGCSVLLHPQASSLFVLVCDAPWRLL